MFKAIGVGVLMIIAGFWMKSHFEPVVQACQSGFGNLVQDFSPTATGNCSSAQDAVNAAPWLIGIGFTVVGGSVLFLVGALAVLGIGKPGAKGARPASAGAAGRTATRPAGSRPVGGTTAERAANPSVRTPEQ